MWYLLIAFAAIVFLLAVAAGVTAEDLRRVTIRKRPSLKHQAKHKESRLASAVRRTKTMLAATGQTGKFYVLLALAAALFFAGLTVGAASGNYFLAPVLALGFAAVPFLYLRFQYVKYQKLTVEELETALSVISMSYERTENILLAVEENIEAINPPVRQVFAEFVYQVRNIDPDIDNAVDTMKQKIHHSVFYEWCDALKRCDTDRSLKYTLRPIVGKLTNIKIAANDMKTILYRPARSYIELAAASACVLWVGLKLVPDGLMITLPSALTQILIAANALMIAITAVITVLETHEINFDV